MGYLRVQRLVQILQNSPCGYDATLQVVDSKAFQRLDIEVLVQLLMGRLLGKHPVVELVGAETGAKITLEVLLAPTVVEHLLGLEVAYQLLHIVVGALTRQELACRYVKEGHATGSLAKMDGSQKVVLFIVEHGVLHGHARRHQLRNAALHQLLGQLGVFQLVTDGHALACPDELGQIGVQGVMRKAGHLVALNPCPIVTMRQRNAQYLGGNDGILAIGFVEVATAKQQ